MRKIPSLFARNYDGDRLVRDEIVVGCDWVPAGEGIATRKYDGTACMVRNRRLYKRYDAKNGKMPPPDFEACQEADPITGHLPGWIPVGDGPDDRWFCAAVETHIERGTWPKPDGTYELIGPKINRNAELFDRHVLVPHGAEVLVDCPRTFEGLRDFLRARPIEGVVFHHPDGRMAKIKARDFGIAWPPAT